MRKHPDFTAEHALEIVLRERKLRVSDEKFWICFTVSGA